MHEWARCCDEAANHQLSISCGLLNHLNSFHRGMCKLPGKFDTDSLLYLLSRFEFNGHTVHMLPLQHLPPPLISTVKSSLFTSHMHVPVHCPWAPGYGDIVQTLLVILTIAGLSPHRPYTHN